MKQRTKLRFALYLREKTEKKRERTFSPYAKLNEIPANN